MPHGAREAHRVLTGPLEPLGQLVSVIALDAIQAPLVEHGSLIVRLYAAMGESPVAPLGLVGDIEGFAGRGERARYMELVGREASPYPHVLGVANAITS